MANIMKIILISIGLLNFICAVPVAKPEDDGGETTTTPVGEETTPTGGDAKPEGGDAKPENGTDTADAKKDGEAATNETTTTAAEETKETVKGDEKGNTTKAPEKVELTLGPDEVTPEHVVTDRYGNPEASSSMIPLKVAGGNPIEIITEDWVTYYTKPATIPGCLCVSRGPLRKFKLIGNIHFPFIKVTPPQYVTLATDESSTICPPCDCSQCTTTPLFDLNK